jgi:hypothetical protein
VVGRKTVQSNEKRGLSAELFSRQTLNECHNKRKHTQKKADPTRSASFVYYERAYMAAFNPASLPVTNADVIL